VYEVVTASTTCGAHTCYDHYRIVSTHKGSWQNIVDPTESTTLEDADLAISISYSTPETADFTGDGVFDFQISGGTIGSAGAGIHRGYTGIWAWNGEYMTRVGFQWFASNYRHHRLYDAIAANDEGDYLLAYDLYVSVIEDVLEDSPSFVDEGNPYDDARIFAAFRLVRLALQQGDTTDAINWESWLELVYPAALLTDASNILIQTYIETGDLTQACQTVTDFIAPYGNATGSIAYLGYGNPDLPNETVCPAE
jgi:hypothetical protein